MKKMLITLLLVIASTTTVLAPPNTPPLPGTTPTKDIGDAEVNAPIGTSTLLLLLFGSGYAVLKCARNNRVRQ